MFRELVKYTLAMVFIVFRELVKYTLAMVLIVFRELVKYTLAMVFIVFRELVKYTLAMVLIVFRELVYVLNNCCFQTENMLYGTKKGYYLYGNSNYLYTLTNPWNTGNSMGKLHRTFESIMVLSKIIYGEDGTASVVL